MNLRPHALLALLTLILAVPLGGARGQDDHVTCTQTSERVLAPFLANLQKAEDARVTYAEKNEQRRQDLVEHIVRLEWSKVVLDKLEKSTTDWLEQQREWAREAIAEIRRRDLAEITRLRTLAVESRSYDRDAEADGYDKAADELSAALAAGTRSLHKGELGFTSTTTGWQEYLAERTALLAKTRAEFAAGTVSAHNPKLGYSPTWEQVLEAIEVKLQEIAETESRLPSYHLPSIGYSLAGKGLDELLAKRRAELADARARIQAGSFQLHVPTLGYTLDRNAVQGLVAEAKKGLRDRKLEWGARTYRTHNPRLSYTLTNGDIDELIAEKQQQLADFQAAGDDAKVHVPEHGGTISGTYCKQQRQVAVEAEDAKGVAYWGSRYAHWQKACAAWVTVRQAELVKLDEHLVEHERLFEADLEARQKHLDTTLTWALGETPCGGSASVDGDPNRDLVVQHLAQLRAMSETEEEARRRTDDYGDKVHVEEEGTVHGDVQDAWAHALRDTGMTRPATPESGLADLKRAKDLADWLGGFAELAELAGASKRIQDFIHAVEALDPSAADFFAQRRALRDAHFQGLEQMIEKGLLSEGKINELLKALQGMGSGSLQVGLAKKRLRELRGFANNLRAYSLPSIRAALAAGEGFSDAVKARYRAAASQSLRQLAAGWSVEGRTLSASARAGWKQMSKLDKGLVFLSLGASIADVVEKTEAGMAASEAVARASVDLAIDLAIGGFPLTAAAEMGTQVLFTSASVYTGDQGYSDATLSNTSKWVAGQVFDGIAAGAAGLGHGWVVMTRALTGEPGMPEILAGVDFPRLRRSLSHVEDRLDAVAPGDPSEATLLRMRQTFRELIRAIQQGG